MILNANKILKSRNFAAKPDMVSDDQLHMRIKIFPGPRSKCLKNALEGAYFFKFRFQKENLYFQSTSSFVEFYGRGRQNIILKMAADTVKLFVSIGLSEQKAKETIKNNAVSQNLKEVIEQVSVHRMA